MNSRNLYRAVSLAALLAWSAGTVTAAPLGTEFTYQGEVVDGTVLAAGPVDMRFRLYDSLVGGLRVDPIGGNGIVQLNVALLNGRFTSSLDFGAAVYAGDARYLEIDMRPAGVGAYTTLAPRQLLAATPYARFAASSQNAVNATNAINAVNATNATNAVNATNATSAATATNALNLGGNAPSFYTNASNLGSGTLADARLSANVALLNAIQTFTAAKTFSAAAAFTAAGAPFTVSSTTLVTNLNADLLDGQHGAFYQNAANLNSGTIADARLSTNVALRNAANAFTALNTFNTASNTSLADGTGAVQVGPNGSQNLGIDNNEIQGRNGAGGPGTLFLNNQGGNVYIGNLGTSLVGIGTASPERFFHVFGGSAGAVTSNSNSLAVFENSGTAYISILTPEANESGILFGTPVNANEGGIIYGNTGTSNGMQFRTNGNNTRMVLTQTGQIGLGTTTPTTDMHLARTGSATFKMECGANQSITLDYFENLVAGTTYGARLAYNGSTNQLLLSTVAAGTVTDALRINRGSSNVQVVGQISAASATAAVKAFKIDHPTDPVNKYLYHSCVESPDMKNIYDGIAVTDNLGYATITLPDYFEALNREFRYQLTVIDSSNDDFIFAKVSSEVLNNEFTIKTSQPGIKVSWQVTGIRHDPVAERNRIVNEVDKEAFNKGRYLYPDAYNLPESKRVQSAAPAQDDASVN